MTKYQLGSPNGWRGGIIETDSDEAAEEIAKTVYGEKEVLDITEAEDQDKPGEWLWLLVVADEEPT